MLHDFRKAAQECAAAGDHDATGEHAERSGALDFRGDHRRHLTCARSDDFSEIPLRHTDRLVIAHRGQGHLRVCGQRELQAVAEVALHRLCGLEVAAEPDREVCRDVIAAHRNHARVHDAAAREHCDIACPAADIDDDHTALDLVLGDDRLRRREHLQHHVVDVEPCLVDNLDHILDRGVGAGDDVRIDFEPVARHADGVAHAFLTVDRELLGQHVHDAALRRNAHRASRVDGSMHVLVANLAMPRLDRHDATAVLRGDVAAGDPDHRGVDRHPGHLLSHVDRFRHGLGCPVDLDHRALANAPGSHQTDAQDSETGGLKVCYRAADFGSSEIECEDAARTGHCIGLRV